MNMRGMNTIHHTLGVSKNYSYVKIVFSCFLMFRDIKKKMGQKKIISTFILFSLAWDRIVFQKWKTTLSHSSNIDRVIFF